MTNMVVFSGGRLESVQIVSGSPADNTTGASFDSAYCDASLQLSNGTNDEVACPFVDAAMAPTTVPDNATCWFHCDAYHLSGFANAQGDGIIFYDSSGFPWVKLRGDNGTPTVYLYGNTGTGLVPVWTQIGANVPFTFARTTFDISVAIDSGGSHGVTLYVNGTASVATGTFSNSSFTNIAAVHLRAFDTGGSWGYSQLMATNGLSTVGGHVFSSRATGAGANAGWTGTYTDVNEANDNDTTFNEAAAAGLRQSYAMGDVTVPAGYYIASVFHWLRAKNDGTAPENIKSVCRRGGTDYVGASNMPGIGAGFAAVGARYDVDPSTSAAWTQAGYNAAEMGFESET